MMYVRDCAKCGDTKPVGEFYLRKRKCGPMFQSDCKACTYERMKPGSVERTRKYRRQQRLEAPGAHRRRVMMGRWMCYRKATSADLTYAQYLQRKPVQGHTGLCPLAAALREIDERLWSRVRIIRPARETSGESPAERYRRLYRTDPSFAAKERLRRQSKKHDVWGCIQSRLRASVKSGRSKGGALFEFLGYSADELKQHIERQFDRRMTWQRFMAGEIHIDHVRPVASFDLSDENQIKECWALPNLRPCWKSENIRKGAREEFLL